MTTPSEDLIPLLSTIEIATGVVDQEHRGLNDKDVEFVYEAFHTFFKGEVQGRNLPEPSSTGKVKEILIGAIFDSLEGAEDDGLFDNLLDGSFAPGGRPVETVEELYVIAFNYLKKSARMWRKNNGPRGYLNGPVRDLMDNLSE
ncbi:hypothetical protein CEQ90_02660 [Lewinellaceae bacterium SD302]|nr:hypothetical protein CEQ90_02660 [Lewinellaceae bacterium SD302]